MPDREPRALVVDLDWRTSVVAVTAVLGLFALFQLVQGARQTLTWIVIGSLLAMALNPLVVAVSQRLHLRRGMAVGAVLVGLIAFGAAAVLLLGPPALREAQTVSY
jgi:predicted PurR-regulated permease PerM